MRATLLLSLLLAGCGGKAYDIAAGPVIYECFGRMHKVAMISMEGNHRAYIRLDGKAGTFAEWSGGERRFIAWPQGKLSISPDRVTFTGSQSAEVEGTEKIARRNLTFDRHSGHLSDTIDLGTDGKFSFEATCSPRPSPPAI
jgi:hypothetical protein